MSDKERKKERNLIMIKKGRGKDDCQRKKEKRKKL